MAELITDFDIIISKKTKKWDYQSPKFVAQVFFYGK